MMRKYCCQKMHWKNKLIIYYLPPLPPFLNVSLHCNGYLGLNWCLSLESDAQVLMLKSPLQNTSHRKGRIMQIQLQIQLTVMMMILTMMRILKSNFRRNQQIQCNSRESPSTLFSMEVNISKRFFTIFFCLFVALWYIFVFLACYVLSFWITRRWH